jgi:hypothetical protein
MSPCSYAPAALLLVGFVLLVPDCSNVSGASPSTSPSCKTNPVGDDDAGDDDDDDDGGSSTCKPGDADGINGGCYAYDLTVDDTGFTPIILKAQNVGQVTLHLTNKGTKPHDFVVDCLPTPNVQGCPPQSCFPAASKIGPLAPGATATASFVTPNPEGIYDFRSDVSGDSTVETDGGVTGLWGQFVIQ